MKALSVRQPWAGLIASGAKTMEVRSRRTHFRGPLLICASLRPSRHPAAAQHSYDAADLGRALCIVDVISCVEGNRSHMVQTGGVDPTGQWCWVFDAPLIIESVPIKGKLGMFDVDWGNP